MSNDLKPRPAHLEYLRILSRLTPAEKLDQAFELSDMTRRMFKAGLKDRFPTLNEDELHQLFLKRLELCHNAKY